MPNASRYDVYYASQSLASVSNNLADNYSNILGAVTVSNLSPITTYKITSLSNDTEYYFMVTATIAGGMVLVSSQESIIPPSYVDYSAAYNSYGGLYNAPNFPNAYVFAGLTADGTIVAWGNSSYGGSGAPSGSGYSFK